MPQAVTCRGRRYEHVETFKHDFFAATGLYRGSDGLAVLKMGRESDFMSFPLSWIGRFLVRREAAMYERVEDLPGIPAYLGKLDGDRGFLHAFVPGHPMERHEPVGDAFFDELLGLVRALHARHIAYVDMNKRQNVLVGDDGRPHLIDFQISLFLPPRGVWRLSPFRWLLARFQHGDWYHCLKHKRRLRPDLLTPAQRAEVERLSAWIRLHRVVARPLTQLRRRILQRIRRSETTPVAGSSAK